MIPGREEIQLEEPAQITEDGQAKLQDSMQKIVNDSRGGMVCIII